VRRRLASGKSKAEKLKSPLHPIRNRRIAGGAKAIPPVGKEKGQSGESKT